MFLTRYILHDEGALKAFSCSFQVDLKPVTVGYENTASPILPISLKKEKEKNGTESGGCCDVMVIAFIIPPDGTPE